MCGDPGAFCLHGLSVYVGTRVFVDSSGKKKKKKGTLLYMCSVRGSQGTGRGTEEEISVSIRVLASRRRRPLISEGGLPLTHLHGGAGRGFGEAGLRNERT